MALALFGTNYWDISTFGPVILNVRLSSSTFEQHVQMAANPYESPAHDVLSNRLGEQRHLPGKLVAASVLSFWLGATMAVLGSFITFYPGAECQHFLLAGTLSSFGAWVPKWSYRFAAIVVCSLCLLSAYSGYHRGIEYQETLQMRSSHLSR